MMFEKLEELCNFPIVCGVTFEMSEQELEDAYILFDTGVSEAMSYVTRLAGEDNDICKVVIPMGDWYIGGDSNMLSSKPWLGEQEIIYFPFGYFTANLWNKLNEDKDNPLFRLLKYFESCTHYLRATALMCEGVEPDTLLTCKVLEECGMLDMFALHCYENVYKNVSDFI